METNEAITAINTSLNETRQIESRNSGTIPIATILIKTALYLAHILKNIEDKLDQQ